jgi:hypothetical protein
MAALLAWFRATRLQLGEWLYWRRQRSGRPVPRLRHSKRRRPTRRAI